jgi:hypothetical protein
VDPALSSDDALGTAPQWQQVREEPADGMP